MSDIHLSAELLKALSEGRADRLELWKIALQHLARLCPHCRDEILLWKRRKGQNGDQLLAALSHLRCRMEEKAPELESFQHEVDASLRRLIALPHSERGAEIRRDPFRYSNPEVATGLMETARACLHEDPTEAEAFARLATQVLRSGQRTHRSGRAQEVLALAQAQVANACRVRGDLRQADRHFQSVRDTVRDRGVTDCMVLAEIDSLEGSLRRDQRRLVAAEALLRRSVLLYRLMEAPRETARSLINLGFVFHEALRTEQALETTQEALGLLDPEADGHLVLCCQHNLAWYLCELEQYSDAETILEASSPLYDRFPDPWTQLRRRWAQGRVAAGLGRFAEAEDALEEARNGFREHAYTYDAALASLELATVLLQQGRTRELRQLAEDLVRIFEAQLVRREATMAVLLFQQAVQADSVNLGLLQGLIATLRDLHCLPGEGEQPEEGEARY